MLATKAKYGAAAPSRVAQREVALVDPHRDLHDLGRQVHVRGVDAAEQRHRPFDQPGHLVEQPGIVHHASGRCVGGQRARCRRRSRARRSAASTITRRSRSAVAASRRRSARRTAPGARKRWPSVRLAAARPCPSSAPSRRSNGTTAPSSRQRMRRSGRTQVKRAGAAPAHRFRPREAAQQRAAVRARSAPRRRSPGTALVQHPELALLPQSARARRRACAGSRQAPAPAR